MGWTLCTQDSGTEVDTKKAPAILSSVPSFGRYILLQNYKVLHFSFPKQHKYRRRHWKRSRCFLSVSQKKSSHCQRRWTTSTTTKESGSFPTESCRMNKKSISFLKYIPNTPPPLLSGVNRIRTIEHHHQHLRGWVQKFRPTFPYAWKSRSSPSTRRLLQHSKLESSNFKIPPTLGSSFSAASDDNDDEQTGKSI